MQLIPFRDHGKLARKSIGESKNNLLAKSAAPMYFGLAGRDFLNEARGSCLVGWRREKKKKR
jgi:hypothetical protein